MDGILIIDKPAGMTSHDVVNRVRRILKTKRIGHAGTLDPFATGVLVMLVGKATRLAQFVDKDEKEYEAVIRFGFETDTGDRTGSPKSKAQSPRSLTVEDIAAVLPQFRGEIEQKPPMFSAKKIDGRKLYQHARKGLEIERKTVMVRISKLEIDAKPISDNPELQTFDLGLKVVCSAGTYIRTLAEDIGRSVGVGAHLTELRRTRAGKFDLSNAISLSSLENENAPETHLLPISEAVSHLPEFVLAPDRIGKTQQGLATRTERSDLKEGDAVRMSDSADNIIAIGHYNAVEQSIKPKIVLV